MLENDGQPVLQDQVKLFGFGADTGIDLPFEFDGTRARQRAQAAATPSSA